MTETVSNQEITLNAVFVGGPFFNLVNMADKSMAARDVERFTRLIDYFEALGATVYNAHRRESWGAEFLGPEEATELDYTEIAGSDLFVAFPGVPASPGTHVEIGWASAMGKPIILFLEREQKHTFLVTGLHSFANVEYVYFDDPTAVVDQLPAAIATVMGRSPRLPRQS
ncbi:nucleoside 2-deoxyribosyltransferase [Microbacteriaceae bacterium VKM Ac-2854]|jgi:nucleoside 2-deoxyribosyltransferase|nr:nucleoside 2-deoxyribosyltransferase [Microbacteriaceae bacterium VKM Ac-2854]